MNNQAAGMPCPVCAVPLVMSERQGIEIDYCPQCRGIWLDRGELDKIVERAATESRSAAPPPRPQAQAQPAYGHRDDWDPHGHGGHRPKRRKSFFEELFD